MLRSSYITASEVRNRFDAGRTFGGWLIVFAAVAACALGCTYSGGNRPGAKAQMSTADPYTYEFERRIPPGGD